VNSKIEDIQYQGRICSAQCASLLRQLSQNSVAIGLLIVSQVGSVEAIQKWGIKVEHRRRKPKRAEGGMWRGGVPLRTGEMVRGPSPENV